MPETQDGSVAPVPHANLAKTEPGGLAAGGRGVQANSARGVGHVRPACISGTRGSSAPSRREGQPTGSRPQGCPPFAQPKMAPLPRRRQQSTHTRARLFFLVPPRVRVPFFLRAGPGPTFVVVSGPRPPSSRDGNPTNPNEFEPWQVGLRFWGPVPGCAAPTTPSPHATPHFGTNSRGFETPAIQACTLRHVLELIPGVRQPQKSKSARYATFWN